MIDWLEHEISPVNDEDILYSISAAQEKFEVRQLNRNGWLVLNWDETKFLLKFAVLEFAFSDADGGNIRGQCLFHGSGPTGSLRECRHTYWGEDGYIFYPNGPIISAAFKVLAEFYDGMI